MTKIAIRHARIEDSPAMAQVLIDATQDTFRGRVPDQCLNWITPEESAANWAKNFKSDQTLEQGYYLLVAETEQGEVVGLAMLGEISPPVALDPLIAGQFSWELRTLQIAPAWQRQGVGRRLLTRAARLLAKERTSHLLVGVLAENPNRVFYEHLGALRLGSRPYDWEGFQTEEILYGWNDITSLVSSEPVLTAVTLGEGKL